MSIAQQFGSASELAEEMPPATVASALINKVPPMHTLAPTYRLWYSKRVESRIDATRKRGRPPTGAISLHVRVEPQLMEQLDKWISVRPEPRPSRPEALRQLAERALGRLEHTEMDVRYTDVEIDPSAEAVFFDIIAYGERFPARFSFEAIEAHANRHGQLVDTPEDHQEYARQWQPELKDLALAKYRRANSVTIAAKDIK